MSASWERESAASRGTLTFTIDVETIKKGIDKAFKKTQKQITVPGFRKGHVPRAIFNQMYGEEALYQDALNEVLPEAYEAAVKEADIKPVSQPEIDVKSMDKGQDWTLTATVDVEPEVKLGDYKGLEVTRQNTRVSQAEVDEAIERQRQQQAELVLKEDGVAENGDTVVIDYVGTVDGEEFAGGSADNYSLELGSGQFIPGFEDQLVGHKTDEEVEVSVTFPDEYQAKELEGKDAIFKVTIHEIKEKQLPELDDEFAKDVDEDVDTLDELKEKTKNSIKEQKQAAAKAEIENEALQTAVANAEFEAIPQSMLDDDTNRQVQQYLSGMQQQAINPEMYFQITNTTEHELRKQFATDDETRAKTELLLHAVVKDAKLEATEEEINAEVAELAAQYGMEEDAIKNVLSADMLAHDVETKKAVDLIADSAKQTLKKDAEDK